MGQAEPIMTDAVAVTNVRDFKHGYATVGDDPTTRTPSFIERRLTDLGVLEMAPSTKPPDGLKLNYSTVLFYFTVIATLFGGFWFMHDRIASVNFERGQEAERRIQQDKEMEKLQREMKLMKDMNELEKQTK